MSKPDWVSDCGTVKLWLGDCLDVLPTLEIEPIAGVITDPPYSSGGAFRGDRTLSTIGKYVQTGVQTERMEFTGDNRDQRAFLAWCSLWMLATRRLCDTGAVLCCFSDWRQVPTITDAIQCGGWVWRNLATWWKPGCRMQKGRFSQSAEYVVYGTNGPHGMDGDCSPQNVFSCATLSGEDKDHIAEKPSQVAAWLVGTVREGGAVLDPFMGSCAFGVASVRAGRSFYGIDCDPYSFDLSVERIKAELGRAPLFKHLQSQQQDLFGSSLDACDEK